MSRFCPADALLPFTTRLEAVTHPRAGRGYGRSMEESRAVLERLERIEALDRAGAEPRDLVEELRALLVEAEAWSQREGGEAGARAVAELRSALAHEMIDR
jgi:hypothetical protein